MVAVEVPDAIRIDASGVDVGDLGGAGLAGHVDRLEALL
jgi:hypothetical protein